MKQLLSMLVIAGSLAFITLSSCKKEAPSSDVIHISSSSYPPPASQPTVNLYLVANNWVNYEGQVYSNTFRGILGTANPNGDRIVTVYIVENGKEAQISQRHITYMGHDLWATNSKTDVTIVYRCSTSLPFAS